jgi:hypothetical protein
LNKDKEDLEKEKLNFIQEIKKHKKEEILSKKKEKLSLWERIKKVLMS